MADKNKQPVVDDDLDDLDDVIDQFSKAQILSSPPVPDPPGSPVLNVSSGRPRTNTRVDAPPRPFPGPPTAAALDSTFEEDDNEMTKAFAEELEKEMANLMKDFAGKPSKDKGKDKDGESEKPDEAETQRLLKAAWEAMMVEGMDGLANAQGAGGKPGLADLLQSGNASSASTSEHDFQAKIKQTMEKLKESNADSSGSTAGGSEEDDLQKALLAALGGLGGEGGEGTTAEEEQELAGFLENMMSQLMSKEVLYDPLKDLVDRFPSYLSSPPSPLSEEDKKRYESQLKCAKGIIAVFDRPGFDDKNPESSKEIVELMSEMQSYGSPPKEIMGDMPAGFGQDGMPEGCCIS